MKEPLTLELLGSTPVDCRQNLGSPLVVLFRRVVVCGLWISGSVFVIEAIWHFVLCDDLRRYKSAV